MVPRGNWRHLGAGHWSVMPHLGMSLCTRACAWSMVTRPHGNNALQPPTLDPLLGNDGDEATAGGSQRPSKCASWRFR